MGRVKVKKKVESTKEQVTREEDVKQEADWLFWCVDMCQRVFW